VHFSRKIIIDFSGLDAVSQPIDCLSSSSSAAISFSWPWSAGPLHDFIHWLSANFWIELAHLSSKSDFQRQFTDYCSFSRWRHCCHRGLMLGCCPGWLTALISYHWSHLCCQFASFEHCSSEIPCQSLTLYSILHSYRSHIYRIRHRTPSCTAAWETWLRQRSQPRRSPAGSGALKHP